MSQFRRKGTARCALSGSAASSRKRRGLGPRLVFDAADIVGESAVYDERRDALLWVDIGGKRVHRLFLTKGTHEAWPAPDFPTSMGLRADGGAIIGLRDRVALWDYDGEFRTLAIRRARSAGQ